MSDSLINTVRTNTFIRSWSQFHIDYVSKAFIISDLVLGLNRINVMGGLRHIYMFIAFVYSLLFNGFAVYLAVYGIDSNNGMLTVKIAQYTLCCAFSFVTCKRMKRYYEELAKFDSQIGLTPNITKESVMLFIHMIIISTFVVATNAFISNLQCSPVLLIFTVENHYFGYLLYLLTQRIRLINAYVGSSMFGSGDSKNGNNHIVVSMNKLIDFYNILINSFDNLIDAIKWQFLIMLVCSFCHLLFKLFWVALMYIENGMAFVKSTPEIGLAVTELLSLFAPCLCSDQVRYEVCILREQLATKLYENKIEKSSRSVARALLSLTETRNLSFSLLRMVDISISLPFTFLGLLITYLIILLQFQKVLSPKF